MSDSFFGFDSTLGAGDGMEDAGGMLSEDEEDYDALNDETFGDSAPAGDWEQDHEKLAELTELRRQNFVSENGLLCEQVAAFILDDSSSRGFDHRNNFPPPPKPKPRPPPGFANASNDHHPLEIKLGIPSLKNVCTVEELERNLIKPPPANSLRLEDLERNLISNQKPAVPPVLGQILRPPAGFITPPPLTHHPPPSQHPLLNQLSKIPPPISPFRVPLSPHQIVLPPNLLPNRMNNVMLPLHHPMGPGRVPPIPLIHPMRPHPPFTPEDEYAGLMTVREKNWLASIQLLQLNTNQPFQEDYYFTMYQVRQSGNHGRKINNSLKNIRDRDAPSSKPQYTPLQFENSLGKLQVGSVVAPRKMIDTEIVESVDSPTPPTPAVKKTKQLLLEIEQMFALLLKAEDALSNLNPHPDPNVNPSELLDKVVKSLIKEEKLRTIMNVRKGKTLILRILPHMGLSVQLIRKLILLLPVAVKNDLDQGWLRALPAIRYYLNLCPFSEIAEFSDILQPHLTSLVPNKFGISVVTNMIERAEYFFSQGYESNDWLDFMSSLVNLSRTLEFERPVVGIQSHNLARHLSRCQANNQDIVTLQTALSNMIMADKK
ncbi:Topoisomerase II-associated protein PAT1 [Nesidiocoris tenuis]|uniref:Topoisomerase II-associated protein PAT1 n=1 Tax=Nesidiocoris tenuis TaxID=355587 RepID=A0ABN7AA95_9HEMI|nr:Topoisomerase II-associated protein PAT1 [Nesidiocoris tenuis]